MMRYFKDEHRQAEMNKKLALLRYLAEGRGWYTAAALTQALQFKGGSISPYLTDLEQAGLVEHRSGPDKGLEYHSRLRFEDA